MFIYYVRLIYMFNIFVVKGMFFTLKEITGKMRKISLQSSKYNQCAIKKILFLFKKLSVNTYILLMFIRISIPENYGRGL